MTKLKIQDLPLAGKKVLIRVDYNVPLSKKDGTITDDTRIRETVPTLEFVLKAGASVILISHLGRPQSKEDVLCSLGICAKRLSQLIAAPVLFSTDCLGKETNRMIQDLKSGQILLLENLRFYPAEESPDLDPTFAKELAKGADYYVNDAFSASHRKHSSIAVIEQYFPQRAAEGLLMQKERVMLTMLLEHPKRPFSVIIGGAKISSKIGLLKTLIEHVDAFFIGGGMAIPFLRAEGVEIGAASLECTDMEAAHHLLKECKERQTPIHLPLDLVIADQFRADATYKTVSLSETIPSGWIGMDIGPITTAYWAKELEQSATIFWNGPLGVFEFPPFAHGTEHVAKTLAQLAAAKTIVIGGGDSLAAVQALDLSKNFSNLSTGGGATLAFLEHGTLPGIEALSDKG